jgi:hypothetical protein
MVKNNDAQVVADSALLAVGGAIEKTGFAVLAGGHDHGGGAAVVEGNGIDRAELLE